MLAVVQNKAAELGPSTVPWWLDWRGKRVAIVASGPSAKSAGVERLKGKLLVIAIKENAYELCPWADVAYGCDLAWWKHRLGLRDFRGLKVGFDPKIREHYSDVNLVRIPKAAQRGYDTYSNDFLLDEPGVIGGGCNSGFQALNLAVQFGAIGVLLIGLDMRGTHWYGRNTWHRANNAGDRDMERWCKHFDRAADTMRRLDVEVLNASPNSMLKCFRKVTVDQALSGWGM